MRSEPQPQDFPERFAGDREAWPTEGTWITPVIDSGTLLLERRHAADAANHLVENVFLGAVHLDVQDPQTLVLTMHEHDQFSDEDEVRKAVGALIAEASRIGARRVVIERNNLHESPIAFTKQEKDWLGGRGEPSGKSFVLSLAEPTEG